MTAHNCRCVAPGHCPWHDTVTTKEEFLACREGIQPQITPGGPCVYLGELHEDADAGQPLYVCRRHGRCTRNTNELALPACTDCKDFLRLKHLDFAGQFVDPLRVTDARRQPTSALHNLLAGRAAFLVGGGPSLAAVDCQQLTARGIFSMGVNNVAGQVPVSAFVCSDPPSKFHWGIFDDPKIMKFLPVPKLGAGRQRGQLRRKLPDGTFEWLNKCAKDCPNVWGFERRGWLVPDHTFFTEPSAAWGNQDAGVERFGEAKTACTMLLGLRLLYYLGARRVFLLGCDFRMTPEAGYAFSQARTPDACASNNNQYRIVNDWLTRLQPTCGQFGLEVYNCYRESGLRAFDYVPFDTAVEICRGLVPRDEFDLSNWYEK